MCMSVKMIGQPVDKTKWWMTCPLDDFCLRRMLAACQAMQRPEAGSNTVLTAMLNEPGSTSQKKRREEGYLLPSSSM
jgi:hypothetical protein